MPIGINEMLEALNTAIASTSWWTPGASALQLTGRREVLGEYGLGVDRAQVDETAMPAVAAGPATHEGRTYSFTRAQCKRMRRTIRKAARADAKRR